MPAYNNVHTPFRLSLLLQKSKRPCQLNVACTDRYGQLNHRVMLYRLLNVFSFLVISNILLSQEYPIPAIGSEWNNTVMDLQSTMGNETTARLEVAGDTIIGSLLYSKLITSWEVGYSQNGDCEFTSSGIGGVKIDRYEGAIRTDENYRVRFIPNGETEVITLYDFSLTVGDSILLSEVNNPYYAYAIKVDTVLIGKSKRKRVTVQGMYEIEDIWIEGIGSLYGLLTPVFRFWESHSYELHCYEENNITLYSSQPTCTRCDIVTATEYRNLHEKVSIFPLPITGQSIVKWPVRINPKRIIIYDLCGRKIYSKSINNIDNITIDKQDIEQGVLILELIGVSGIRYRDQIIVL